MILLTGAAGKTGRSILKFLSQEGKEVMPLVRDASQAEELQKIAKFNCITGDLQNPNTFRDQIDGADIYYYICPNVNPEELRIGKNLIYLAKKNKISHFVYHSVLHPQIEDMPHHWLKMRMEEALFESGINFTILQPCAYMQNIQAGWKNILKGKYVTPYNSSARISIVDLDDVAEVAASVMGNPLHFNAVYELAGPEPLSQLEVSRLISQALGQHVDATEQSIEEWQQNAIQNGMTDPQLTLLQKMFEYYDRHGLVGNSNTLYNLLKRPPTTFVQFLQRILKSGELP